VAVFRLAGGASAPAPVRAAAPARATAGAAPRLGKPAVKAPARPQPASVKAHAESDWEEF
jgi:hypothetical protein